VVLYHHFFQLYIQHYTKAVALAIKELYCYIVLPGERAETRTRLSKRPKQSKRKGETLYLDEYNLLLLPPESEN
jgi:site-specific recombinase XerD